MEVHRLVGVERVVRHSGVGEAGQQADRRCRLQGPDVPSVAKLRQNDLLTVAQERQEFISSSAIAFH